MNSSKCWTDPFKLLYKERAKSTAQWKEQGKWAAGYIYSHVPKELLYAAGILPVQMLEDIGYTGQSPAAVCRNFSAIRDWGILSLP